MSPSVHGGTGSAGPRVCPIAACSLSTAAPAPTGGMLQRGPQLSPAAVME